MPSPFSWPRRRISSFVALATALLLQGLLASCATPSRLPAVPDALASQAQVSVPNARFFADRDNPVMFDVWKNSYANETAWLKASGRPGPLPPAAFLTISGGGGDGAFGAGLLNGWSEAGTRPEFKMVTGVSTGALIAPFAFLGAKYDHVLKEAYTETTDKDIYTKRPVTAALFNDGMADTTPMAHMISKYVTRDMLDAIAAEYAKGRLLFVGTTNLDTREPVIWNMGAIASSKDPGALNLFRQVIRASASIPGVFNPMMIDVTVNGVRYQEMHVDGGVTRQVFMYPPNLHFDMAAAALGGGDPKRTVYIIRNSRLDADWASTDRRTLPIANRSVSSLIQTQGQGDLIAMYLTSMRDHVDYNLAYIPRTFTVPKKSEFDETYMRALFERGRDMAAHGYPWEKYPPVYDPANAWKVRRAQASPTPTGAASTELAPSPR